MAGLAGQFDDCDDTPREVDLLTEEHVEDLLDAVECLRGKVEQLQIQCEKLIYEKGKVEDQLIEREKEVVERESYYEKEMGSLRKLNVKLMAQVESSQGSNTMPVWAKTSLDAETAVDEKNEAERQVKSLQIVVREKDKQISNLEWQVMDAEATVTSIQAERDRLAVELDGMLAREEENLEAYHDLSDDHVVFTDDEYESSNMQHSSKKNARRHLSDLTRRDDFQIEDFTDFVRNGKNVPALSNNDVPSATDVEFQGGLKRTTNFSNINNMDEFTDFHLDDDNDDDDPLDLSASYPSAKIKSLTSGTNWHSFGSDSDSCMSAPKNNQSASWVLSDLPSNEPSNEGPYEEGCFDDAGDWALDAEPAPLGALVGCKNGSCRSSSSAYFSDNSTGQDPWMFTPDSIIDVSTGEELKLTPAGSKNSLVSDNDQRQNEVLEHKDIKLPKINNHATSEHTMSIQDNKNSTVINEYVIQGTKSKNESNGLSTSTDQTQLNTKSESACQKSDSSNLEKQSLSENVNGQNSQTGSQLKDCKNHSSNIETRGLPGKCEGLSSNHKSLQVNSSEQDTVICDRFAPAVVVENNKGKDIPQDEPLKNDLSGRNGLFSNNQDNSKNFERSESVRSDGAMATSNKEPVHHQRINSEPTPDSPSRRHSDGKDGIVKLQAYQKWRMSGKKGQPPAKLKISQC